MRLINCEAQFKALFERTKDAVFLLDLNGVHIAANKRASEIFGYEPEELERLTYKDLSLEIDASEQVMKRLLAGENIPKYRRLFRHKDGRIIPVEIDIEIVKNSKGAPIYLQSIVQDISERVAFEKHTAYNAKFQKMLMEIAIDFLRITPGHFDEALNQLLKSVGLFCQVDRTYYFRYDHVAKTTSNTHEWCAEGVTPEIENLQDIPFTLIETWVNAHFNGNTIYIPDVQNLEESTLKEILSSQGIKTLITIPVMNGDLCLGFVGFDAVNALKIWTDEERALLEMLSILIGNAEIRLDNDRKLSLALNQAEAANSAKSKFLANMSHEIRTPLNGILGMLNLLIKSGIDEHQKEYANKAEAYSKNLLNTLNDILDYAKMEKSAMKLEDEVFKLSQVFDEIEAIVYPSAHDKGLTFGIELDPRLPDTLMGDVSKFKQVLINLLGNSVKFTHAGSVNVEVTYESQQDLTVNLLIVVKDTGIGIDADHLNRIFEPFMQVEDSVNRRYGGTGLGLSIVKEIVELMHGHVIVKSTINLGSAFYIILPFQKVMTSLDETSQKQVSSLNHETLQTLKSLEISIRQQKPKDCKHWMEIIDDTTLHNGYKTQLDELKRYLKHFEFESAHEIVITLIDELE